MSNLTADEIIERLCQLQRQVVEQHFGFDRPADCFCGKSGFGAVHARSSSFRNDGHVLEFIELAVREKLRLVDRQVASAEPVAWMSAVDDPYDMHPRLVFVSGPHSPKSGVWTPLYSVHSGDRAPASSAGGNEADPQDPRQR